MARLLSVLSSFFVLLSKCSAQSKCDLTIESLVMANPDPTFDTPVFETDSPEDILSFTMYVRNNGPDILEAATSGMNYDVKMYISALDVNENMDDPVEVTVFDLKDGSNKRGNSLQVQPGTGTSYEHFYTSADYSITYPSNKCLTHSHLCVVIVKDPAASYDDNNSTNDFDCLKFIKGTGNAGLTDCPSDVAALNLELNPAYANFSANSSVNITFSIDLKNMGGTKVPGGPSNIGFFPFIENSNSDQFDLDDTLSLGNLAAGIDEWDTTTYSGHQVSIQIPVQNCQSYIHFCVAFVDVANVDIDLTNNIVCLDFGESGIGPIDCPDDVQPTDAVVITTHVEVATSPNMTTAGAVTVQPENDGLVNLHVGAVVGIALGCAIAGAGLAVLSYFLRAMMSKNARVHSSSVDGNHDAEKPKIEKSPEKEKLPDDNTTNPEDSNKNGEAKPTPEENMELENVSTE